MHINPAWNKYYLYCLMMLFLNGCTRPVTQNDLSPDDPASRLPLFHGEAPFSSSFQEGQYAWRVPENYDTNGHKTILVDPQTHAWGAYDANGELVRAGMATAGADYCQDEGRPCRTDTGTFHIYALGDENCVSKKFPLGEGGALMPFCMFFNNGQSLHGSPDQLMIAANISHGCVHLRIPDAEWLRYHFAGIGTRVVILPYD